MKKILVLLILVSMCLFATGKYNYAVVKINSKNDHKFFTDLKIDIDREFASFDQNKVLQVYVTESEFKSIKEV